MNMIKGLRIVANCGQLTGAEKSWCRQAIEEIERLRVAVRDAYIEGHEEGGQCWSENFKPGRGYAENHWHESDAKKAVDAVEGSEV